MKIGTKIFKFFTNSNFINHLFELYKKAFSKIFNYQKSVYKKIIFNFTVINASKHMQKYIYTKI